eukprot:CAMPEP_0175977964 /NCGR_PEP_ID=MMETSP0108-20121206/45377_1 /TAXON_ID=195067 ORGANISM="Goniomonas pacifica, Strain CCMP1869" /NCGR_SAMPLE_ID=MMETSP0108 /ASSEMBLY_ACC=CAM_ASM_000204 /LENGTH=106 /DNA_ID=CAMNT_0017308051 /DNA_START=210 /DNA_END=530 /DNA_ORIENTATION=+
MIPQHQNLAYFPDVRSKASPFLRVDGESLVVVVRDRTEHKRILCQWHQTVLHCGNSSCIDVMGVHDSVEVWSCFVDRGVHNETSGVYDPRSGTLVDDIAFQVHSDQ